MELPWIIDGLQKRHQHLHYWKVHFETFLDPPLGIIFNLVYGDQSGLGKEVPPDVWFGEYLVKSKTGCA